MNIVGTKVVKFTSLVLPGGFKKLLDEERIDELAKSIETNGLLHLPVVRKKDSEVVSGIDRLAAMKKLGRDRVEVRLCEATDDEVKLARIAENIHRRTIAHDDRKKQLAEYVDIVEKSVTQSVIIGQPVQELRTASTRKQGRPSTTRGDAIKKVAEQTGLNERTVRRAVEEREREEEQKEEPTKAPVDMLGFDIEFPAEHSAMIAAIVEAVDTAAQLVSRAQAAITAVENQIAVSKEFKRRVDTAGMKQRLASAGAFVRQERPESVCPYCKLTDQMENCAGCRGSGYLIKTQTKDLPKELLATGAKAGIYVIGRWRVLSSL